MSRSAQLRLRDVRAVFRVIGECRDLGAIPEAWYERLFDGACGLVRARAATGGEARWRRPGYAIEPHMVIDTGFSAKERAAFIRYMRKHGPASDPLLLALGRLNAPLVTRTRRQLISDDDAWYASVYFKEFRRAGGVDHCLNSVLKIDGDGGVSTMGLHRAVGDRDFLPRECAIVKLLHWELRPLIGTVLVRARDAGDRLPARVAQTLACLLGGSSEKQVARRLGVSITTVHQYVGTLYERFGVHSRSELLARHVRRDVGIGEFR